MPLNNTPGHQGEGRSNLCSIAEVNDGPRLRRKDVEDDTPGDRSVLPSRLSERPERVAAFRRRGDGYSITYADPRPSNLPLAQSHWPWFTLTAHLDCCHVYMGSSINAWNSDTALSIEASLQMAPEHDGDSRDSGTSRMRRKAGQCRFTPESDPGALRFYIEESFSRISARSRDTVSEILRVVADCSAILRRPATWTLVDPVTSLQVRARSAFGVQLRRARQWASCVACAGSTGWGSRLPDVAQSARPEPEQPCNW